MDKKQEIIDFLKKENGETLSRNVCIFECFLNSTNVYCKLSKKHQYRCLSRN